MKVPPTKQTIQALSLSPIHFLLFLFANIAIASVIAVSPSEMRNSVSQMPSPINSLRGQRKKVVEVKSEITMASGIPFCFQIYKLPSIKPRLPNIKTVPYLPDQYPKFGINKFCHILHKSVFSEYESGIFKCTGLQQDITDS